MELNEYNTMYEIENNYWWYVGLRKLIFSYVDNATKQNKEIKILDAGCGTGKILENFNAYNAYGFDFVEEALKFCNLRKLNNLMRASICDLPFHDDSFDIAISLDVLCHIDGDQDMKILSELYRVLNKNGLFLLHLPAYNFLQSTHDKAVKMKHRYTKNEVKKKLEQAGFIIERITYRNFFLFPLAFIVRILKKIFMHTQKNIKSDLTPLPALLNKMLTVILLFENRLIHFGISFPFGLSIYCVARKKR